MQFKILKRSVRPHEELKLIEADNPEQAKQRALCGDGRTVKEETLPSHTTVYFEHERGKIIDPKHINDLWEALHEADTAFACIAICDKQGGKLVLTPQAEKAFLEAREKVQDAIAAVRPNGMYALAVENARKIRKQTQ